MKFLTLNKNKVRKIYILLLLVKIPFFLQSQDSIRVQPREKAKEIITDKFPSTRFLDVEYETLTPTDYNGKMYNESYEKGRITHTNRFRMALNYPVYKTPRFAITPLLRYRFENIQFSDVQSRSTTYPDIYHGTNENFHYISTSINTVYFSKLFEKHVMYSLTLAADASEKGFEHLSGTMVGIMMLERSVRKSMSVGIIILVDKRASLPVIPAFSYEYKFAASSWKYETFFPWYFYFRRPIAENGRLSLGMIFDSDKFCVYPEYKGLSNTYNLRKTQLKTGFIYEHYMNSHFLLSFRGGFANTIQWKVTRKSSRNTIADYSDNVHMYFNLGFSYNL